MSASVSLVSGRHDVSADVVEFTDFANAAGWGDGLPLVPPTEERVAAFIAATGADAAEVVVDKLPPSGGVCTIEKIAVNAVMAGAPAASLPLLAASLRAMAHTDFELHALNATTGSVVPMLFVNGPIRDALSIPYESGCLGGVAGPAPAIGRAIRLVMRNVAGQQIGVTSQSTFGQPGRVAGIVCGEWEERSPWAPLAERRGVPGDAVTVHGAMGTLNVCDVITKSGIGFLEIIARSMAVPGANGFLTASAYSEVMVLVNPVWASVIGRDFPDIDEVIDILWKRASLPLSDWPEEYHPHIAELGRVRDDGRVRLVQDPSQILFAVAGGLGSLHATVIHNWGATTAITAPVTPFGK
ncbi:MAG: hypothetical protein AB7L13_15635 [Acidimicrobiia bacterium]